MTNLKSQTFVCIDCEATGLDTSKDRIVEIAAVAFTFDALLNKFETLVDPECEIPKESIAVHHITQEMIVGKPKIQDVLAEVLDIIEGYPIIGHGIRFDIDIIDAAAKQYNIPCRIQQNLCIDTVRLARLYGESPSNSLEQLRLHFNIEEEGAHRAMNDVLVNIQVFKRLTHGIASFKELQQKLAKPIFMKTMPLGKHKGRPLRELPLDYLLWAANQNFDSDLLYSLRSEVNRRKNSNQFVQATNPFSNLELKKE